MTSIDLETLLTILFVEVDDWYGANKPLGQRSQVGHPPIFKDSEVITLMIAQEYIPYPTETQYLGVYTGESWGLVSAVGGSKPVQSAGTRLAACG